MRRLPQCGVGRSGFTLVELLVVVAIIAILASALMPALAKAKVKAGRAGCSSNLRQLWFSEHAYALDHEGNLPLGYRSGRKQWNTMVYSGTADKYAIFGALVSAGLVGNPKALYCPAERAPEQAYNTPVNPWTPGSPGVNVQGGYGSRPVVDWSTNDFPASWPKLDTLGFVAVLADGVGQPARLDSRHRTGVNAAFSDGSVRWVLRQRFEAALSACNIISPLCNDAQDLVWSELDQAR